MERRRVIAAFAFLAGCWLLPTAISAASAANATDADEAVANNINGAESSACSATAGSGGLRHWATLELAGVPVFLHQRLDRKGHFLIEPLTSLPGKAEETLNASCVRLDRLTRGYYLSFPVLLFDDEVLYQAKERLKHVAPKSVAFMRLLSAELLSERLPGGWRFESFRVSSEGRVGYLRINCPDHEACVGLRSQLLRHQVDIFEHALLRISAASGDGCVALDNITKQVTVPHSSQLDVAHFSRPKIPRNCTLTSLKLFRDFYIDGQPTFVIKEAGGKGGFWLEPLLTFSGDAEPFRNASGWPGLRLQLRLREPGARNAVATRLTLLGGGSPRFLHLVDYRLQRSGSLSGLGVGRLRLSVDRGVAHLRLLAPNMTDAGAKAMAELGRHIAANPSLLFDALQFNFSFSADDACQTPYWTSRRVVTPHRSQYLVSELHRSSQSCIISKQPQVAKIAYHQGLPLVLHRRIDRSGHHFLIEPLLHYQDRLSLDFDYARAAHFLSLNVTVQSSLVAYQMRRNLTHLPARSVAFMLVRELSLRPAANISGVQSVEFYMSYDQREGYLRLYCRSMAICAGLKNHLKSSELLMEQLPINVTFATPDDGCVGQKPIAKLIVARAHKFDLAYLREKSPPQPTCSDAAFPLVQTPLQPTGSCQLVVHRSLNLAGNLSYFVEPAFCFRAAEKRFDYVRGRAFLRLQLGLANASLLPGVLRAMAAGGDSTVGATVNFMELWSLQLEARTRLGDLEAGGLKASFDRTEAEFRIYCKTGNSCWHLHSNLQDSNTVLLENFNLQITATLPSYQCWMPRPMRKQIGSPNSTFFDLSYLNSKTRQLPGCPKELPIRLFALKVIDSCPTFIYKREDSKAGFYVEPQFCFNGKVQYGYSYMAGSHYVSIGVDLNRPAVLTTVAAQLTDLAPKRVAFLEVRKVNLSRTSLQHPAFLLDGFFVSVDRRQGVFRILCANRTACRDLGSNVTSRPWILFERIQVDSLMANGVDCELSTSTHQQPSSASGDFHLPLDIFRKKLPTVAECPTTQAPQLFQNLAVDGCPVLVYKMPGAGTGAQQHQDLLVEPLLCFHGNAANVTARRRDYLAGEEYVSIRLLLQSHSILRAVQNQLALVSSTGALRFAQLWDLRVSEEAEFNSLRVIQVGVSADQLTAELRVACRGDMCEALMDTLADEPADYLKSIALSVTSLMPETKCYFKSPVAKRPITIGYSRSLQCAYDYLPTTVSPKINFQMWMSQRCSGSQWTSCALSTDGTVAYFFSVDTASWNAARNRCRSLNGDLATISSSAENRQVFTHLTGNSWIGMYKSGSSFVWVTPTGTGYQNFRPIASSSYEWQYGCVSMSATTSSYPYYLASGQWIKKSCYKSLHYVCKFSMRMVL